MSDFTHADGCVTLCTKGEQVMAKQRLQAVWLGIPKGNIYFALSDKLNSFLSCFFVSIWIIVIVGFYGLM